MRCWRVVVCSDLTRFLERGLSGLVRLPDLPPYSAVRYTADTWEHVLYTDALQRLVFQTSYASYHSNQQQQNHPLLLLAHRLTNEVTESSTFATLRSLSLLSAQDYRACGVIYGQYARYLKEVAPDSSQAERMEASGRMRRMWRMYLDLAPDDQEIRRAFDSRHNPYTGELIDE